MALPPDLMEAIQEVNCSAARALLLLAATHTRLTRTFCALQHTRIESKRGSGSVKKGRSRVEALMAQCVAPCAVTCIHMTR